MDTQQAAHNLASYIYGLEELDIDKKINSTYGHMGATISDAILQAGLNYENVVSPRINRILNIYTNFKSTSDFIYLLNIHGAKKILQWRHDEKPRRVRVLAEELYRNSVETEQDLMVWLRDDKNCKSLLLLNGIGPKTVDYIKLLVNVPAIAVDRHIRRFVSNAGINKTKYEDIREIVSMTADILDIPYRTLDHAIWKFVALSD